MLAGACKMHLSVIGRISMRKIATAILISASLLISACNTVKGLGEDIESVGEAGDRAI
jgi:predicted small secreted protein